MKKLLLILMALMSAILMANNIAPQVEETSVADTVAFAKPYILDDMPRVRVHQDSLMEMLLKARLCSL